MPAAVHINFDDAWDSSRVPFPTLDFRAHGPSLRYMAGEPLIARVVRILAPLLDRAPFLLYGSGDFHYLAAWFLQLRLEHAPPPGSVTLISFDNHPDWDIRPPRWACGGWINRALESPLVARASIWGCGNFELGFPSRLFRNRRALCTGRLHVNAWAQRQSPATARRFDCMTRAAWRDRFEEFTRSLGGGSVYITLDLDCLDSTCASTNWENGLFTPDDLRWALGVLHQHARVIGGDMCGAYSRPVYSRVLQRFAGWFDHPRLPPVVEASARALNHATLAALWPAFTGASM